MFLRKYLRAAIFIISKEKYLCMGGKPMPECSMVNWLFDIGAESFGSYIRQIDVFGCVQFFNSLYNNLILLHTLYTYVLLLLEGCTPQNFSSLFTFLQFGFAECVTWHFYVCFIVFMVLPFQVVVFGTSRSEFICFIQQLLELLGVNSFVLSAVCCHSYAGLIFWHYTFQLALV